MVPPYHIYAFGHGGPLQIFRKIAVAKLVSKRLVAYQGPEADPGGCGGCTPLPAIFNNALDKLRFSVISNLFITMSAHPWRDVSPPIIRQHPPHYFHVPKLGISERDDLFLVFISFSAKNLASADVSMLLNHPPNIEKWQKTVDFAKSSPLMLNIDLHPCS